MKKWLLTGLIVFLGPTAYAMQHQTINADHATYDVIKVTNLSQLELYLKSPQTNRYYQKFSNIQQALPRCAQLNFAMNAGMYHANFQPVGLYVEKGQKFSMLNEAKGFGNFFMQPNGVLAWNHQQATIKTTADYKHQGFNALYATQSGPMLLYNRKINRNFLVDSSSLKIRNGVGVKNNQLYFVISRQQVSFYQFAQFFKQQLKIDHALYLDGSISSLYSGSTKQHDQMFNLGPIVAEVDRSVCK
ncbi:phosphodiester glycosidase family protein [Acinetobacter sp. NIPH 2699]|uniref:phosphodiester glycosidase family protein n=1 Tax=Acinetobacter sp. NIPH 2699 TaxID=2923433 RepID=UPI001F4B1109|nr:phosphodiester glycosidase family protein [Acinetobacter sp. NIPH 2699]MCH7336835.1 phosphodiester glycosidase family protein [Acinetobacter sp. NIPH 2699]